MDNQTISPRQFMFLVMMYTIGSSILIIPTPATAQAKQDAWMSVILSILIGLLLMLFYSKIGSMMKGKTFVQGVIETFGGFFGRILCFFYLSFIYILAALVLRNIGDFMTTQIIPDTPLQFTHILFLLVVIWGAWLGIEAIGRTSEIFVPWIILLFCFLLAAVSPQIKVDNLQPMLGEGLTPVLGASTVVIGTPLLEMIILLMIFPYVKERKKAIHGWLLGVLLGGGVLVAITLLSILVLGSDLTSINNYPSYVIAEKINIAGFLEGLEIIVAIIWMLTIFFKLTILYYACTVGIAQFLKMENHRPLLFPIGIGIIVLSIIAYPNVAYYETFVKNTWFPYALTHGLVLPLFVWAGLSIKNRIRKKNTPSENGKQNQTNENQATT
ncbi:endospore germination permease [Halobacillus salinarum]|uniref:Endospore germination permease n=1 Tax=Halobacillus salinarum TaxID=2932257 RepID=A0ABY4EMP6_9BACI|nr:endospore germination permease [Halobacillus salinarum]UOQ45123.1 endospore germination permease [Halobacillus salinarum]